MLKVIIEYSVLIYNTYGYLNSNFHLGAKTKEKRLGRGPGSGYGRTCGRGLNGAKSRSGTAIRANFESNNRPYVRRIPKYNYQPEVQEYDY